MRNPPAHARRPLPGIWHLAPLRLNISRGRVVYRASDARGMIIVTRPRWRTGLRQTRYALQDQHRRRTLARQCRAMGFTHVGMGAWYDPAADCTYLPLYEEW